ncbi:hypothetical protein ACS0TY_029693 [Phlomoides rotata]
MALSSFSLSNFLCVSFKIDRRKGVPSSNLCTNRINQRHMLVLESTKTGHLGQPILGKELNQCTSWNSLGGSRTLCRKSSVISASWLQSYQIASSAFTWGTVVVLPFYTSMIVAPQAEFVSALVVSDNLDFFFSTHNAFWYELLNQMVETKMWLKKCEVILYKNMFDVVCYADKENSRKQRTLYRSGAFICVSTLSILDARYNPLDVCQ